jgi:hypothetical protein
MTDVEVELREVHSAGPTQLPPGPLDGTEDIREWLTTSLGHLISTQSTPHIRRTAGFFINEGNSEQLRLFAHNP